MDGTRLETWKEIAAYLNRSVRTTQRWHTELGMPVHREAGGLSDRVFVFTDELDRWRMGQSVLPEMENGDKADGLAPVNDALETAGAGAAVVPAGYGKAVSLAELNHTHQSHLAGENTSLNGKSATEATPGDCAPANSLAHTLAAASTPETHNINSSKYRRWIGGAMLVLLLAVGAGLVFIRPGPPARLEGKPGKENLAKTGRAAAYTEEYTRTAVFPGARPGTLHRVTIEEDLVSGWDREKQLLWTRDSGHPFQPQFPPDYPGPNDRGARELAILDLENDGEPEILAILNLSKQVCILVCLDSAGRERWRVDPSEPLRFGGRKFNPELSVSWFKPADLDGDGRLEIMAVATHYDFPCKLMILRPDGRCTGEYIHSGHLTDFEAADLDGDGTAEIVCTAINNGSGNGVLFVLDSRFPDGCSPQPDTPDYQCRNHPPGVEKFYLRFPRECTSYAWPFAGMAVLLIGENIQAGTHCLLTNTNVGGSIVYRLDRSLHCLDRSPNMGFAMFHRYLERRGDLTHAYSPACIANLGPIQYWDGERFVPRWTMNRCWQDKTAELGGGSRQTR